MTALPAPRAAGAAPRPLDPATLERRRHLALMGYGEGAIELVAGSNEPSNPNKIALLVWTKQTYGVGPHTRKWIEAGQLAAAERHAATLAERWGNVYISAGTYGRTPNAFKGGRLDYSRSVPLAGGSIVADDVTAEGLALLDRRGLPPTWATETSPGNYQIGIVADELLTPDDRRTLAEGLALLLGADPSGSDAQQLVRLAGTLNTKAKCDGRPGDPGQGVEPEGWRVRLRHEGPRYSVERLARVLLPGGLGELRRGGAEAGAERGQSEGNAQPADPAAWANLPDGAALMASGRYRRFFTNRPQLAALAMGQRVTLATTAGLRDSGSEQVAVLVSNLLTTGNRDAAGDFVAGLGAPPLTEIRAVALHWRETLRPGYDLNAYRVDVDRLIAKTLADTPGYAPETTRGATVAAEAPRLPQLAEAQHKGPGRPAGQRADRAAELAALLGERVGEVITRGTIAKALGLKVRMVAYLLADLMADGRAELQRAGRGLRVVRCAINSPAPDVQSPPAEAHAEGAATLQTADVQLLGSTHPPLSSPCPAPAAGAAAAQTADTAAAPELATPWNAGNPMEAPAPSAGAGPECKALDLGALLAEGLRTLGQLLNPDTGELQRVRVDADLLRAWVAQQAPVLDTAAIEQLLPAARAEVAAERRRARAAGEWAAERESVRALPDAQLLALCKRRASRHAGAVKRGDGRAPYYAALAAVADSERRRRGLDLAALDAEAQGERPRKGKRQSFADRRAAQQGQADRRGHLLGLFDARAHESVTTAPAAQAHQEPPPDDGAPHPAEGANSTPKSTATMPAPSAAAGIAERLCVVGARPRVEVARRYPVEGPTPARVEGYSADECDTWLHAQGWRRGPDGAWQAPTLQGVQFGD